MSTMEGMEDLKNKRARRLSEIRAFSNGSVAERTPSESSEQDFNVCWICLDTERPEAALTQPCNCPRYAHSQCLARWQLQSAGTRKETHCEFCDRTLPDWKQVLTPRCGANAPAVMNVNFDGRTYSFEVKPGVEGYRQFTEAIRRAFSLPDDSELNITFTCDEPYTAGTAGVVPPVVEQPPPAPPAAAGSLLTLQGAGAYDAAVHCASVSAARRMLQQRVVEPNQRSTPGAPRATTGATSSSSAAAGRAQAQNPFQGDQSGAAAANAQNRNKRLAGFGRKLRSALCDLLTIK